MTNLQCSKCGTTLQIGDRFCEECGTPVGTQLTDGCTKCGAAAAEVDPEGFCTNCGFRQERHHDRWEIVISDRLAGVSDRGLRHPHNQDFVGCASSRDTYILVVCDGVSSSASPDLAAKVAAQSAVEVLTTVEKCQTTSEITALMQKAITSAMMSVCAVPYLPNPEEDSPSTTIVAAVVVNRIATIGWLGDSRAYWISPQGSQQLTKDDSWLNEVVSSGEMQASQAQLSPHAHAITRWLGADAANFEPSIINFEIPGSGHLLLCTDGLWHYAPEITQIESLIQANDAITVAHTLTDFAKLRGGYDNITVAVLTMNNKQ